MVDFGTETRSAAQDNDVIVITAKPQAGRPKTKQQPPYAVVVLNDDAHTFEYVTEALSSVCGYTREKSFRLACEIHSSGRANVWTGSKEVAELKRDQLHGFGPDDFSKKPVTFPLGVEIEALPG